MSEATISLTSLLVSTKTVDAPYPGFSGLTVSLSFLSREEMLKIRKKATKITIKNRVPSESIDEELFLSLYCEAVIKGWKGLKLSYVKQLAPIELHGHKDDEELPYSKENALALLKASADFDSFVSETSQDLANFQ